jgi:hypothetical protein
MAVPAAVALVRQVQGVVDNPELLKENNCVSEVVSFLDSQLEHPDSRARLGAARALAQLAVQLGSDDWGSLELHHASKVYSSLQQERLQGTVEDRDEELSFLLAAVLGHEEDLQGRGIVEKNAGNAPAEVVRFNIDVAMVELATTAIRGALVQMGGVVSVTFETGCASDCFLHQIVVGVRSSELVQDTTFVEDLRKTVEEELQRVQAQQGGTVLVGNCAPGRTLHLIKICGGSGMVDGEEDIPGYLDDSDDEPLYLDGSEDEDSKREVFQIMPGRGCFLGSQRLQEHEDDPSLIARLKKAHDLCQRRKLEEQMRLSRVLSVITPSRSRMAKLAAERGTLDLEMPGVE